VGDFAKIIELSNQRMREFQACILEGKQMGQLEENPALTFMKENFDFLVKTPSMLSH
jgi:hypothetical protein